MITKTMLFGLSLAFGLITGNLNAQEKLTNAEKLGFPKGKKIILLH